MPDITILDLYARTAGFNSYNEYITSSHWRHVRATNLKRSCFVCRHKTGLQLHHLTYERLGCERSEDLVTLCERCHKAAHAQSKKPGSNLKTAHFEVTPGKEKKRPGEGKFVHWMKLTNKSKKETITQLQDFLETHGLLGEGKQPTQKARELRMIFEVNGKERWSLEQFIRYRSLAKKGRTLRPTSNPVPPIPNSSLDQM